MMVVWKATVSWGPDDFDVQICQAGEKVVSVFLEHNGGNLSQMGGRCW